MGIRVWAQHTKNYTFSEKEVSGCGVVEIMTIVILDGFDSAPKLCGNISKILCMVGNVSDIKRRGNICHEANGSLHPDGGRCDDGAGM